MRLPWATRVPVWTLRGPKWVPREAGRALTGRYRDVPLSSAVRAYLDARAYLWVPQKGILRVETNMGSVGDDTPGTPVTTGGASSTKGTPAELITSTSFDAFWVVLVASNYAAATSASDGAMDLLGGAATEEVLVANMLMGYCGTTAATDQNGKYWNFPLHIAASTRLAAQAAGLRLSTAMQVWIILYGGALPPFRTGELVTTYGMGTVPNGTAITPGVSGAEPASWTQITASSTLDHFAFVPSFQATNDGTMNGRTMFVEIGVGAATEESIGEWIFGTSGGERVSGPYGHAWPAFTDVPSGTRLAMRVSNSGTNDAGYDVVIHAVT